MEFIEENKNNILKDLKALVDIDSVSSNKEKVREALDCTLEIAKKLGFDVKSVLEQQVGVVEVGTGQETLGVLAHIDVVDEGNIKLWKSNPFKMEIRNEVIYGRGTLDDKGAVIAVLYAMKAVKEMGKPFKKKIQLIMGTQEEAIWTDMESYVKAYPLPDYGFTPDGSFPVCNVEKGCLDIVIEIPLNEKSGGCGKYLTKITSGYAANIVPGEAVANITELETGDITKVKTVGKAVHSSIPEKGMNAIFIMAEKLKEYGITRNKLFDILETVSDKFKDPYGKELGLYSSSEYFNGVYTHRTVFTPTIFKVENGEAEININVRFAYGQSPDNIIETIGKLFESFAGRIKEYYLLPAVLVSKDKPFLKILAETYEEVTGLKNEFCLGYGASYSKVMPNIVSWGPIFPDAEDTCHEENEHISVKDLFKNIEIFAKAIEKICLSDESFK